MMLYNTATLLFAATTLFSLLPVRDVCSLPISNVTGGDDFISLEISQLARLLATVSQPSSLSETSFLPVGYNKYETPSMHNRTKVDVMQEIITTPVINELDEELTFHMLVAFGWTDRRLANPNASENETRTLRPTDYDKLWMPTLRMGTGNQSPLMMHMAVPLTYEQVEMIEIKLHTGLVTVFARVKLSVSCSMDFSRYPADSQICQHIIFFQGDTEIDLNPTVVLEKRGDDKHPQYFVSFLMELREPSNVFPFKDKLILDVDFSFERKLVYHLLQTYLPSGLIVLLTWMSMFISPDHMPERVSLCVTTMLSLFTLFGTMGGSAPKVGYVKAVDVWMFASLFFVFIITSENIIALKIANENFGSALQACGNYFSSWKCFRRKQGYSVNESTKSKRKSESSNGTGAGLSNNTQGPATQREVDRTSVFQSAKTMDRLMRVGFIIMFVACNVVYWTVLMCLPIKD